MRKVILCLPVILWCLFAELPASGIETNGAGARATAMGGAYHAVADDWSAMYWNPAGLAFTKGWSAGLHAAYVMPRGGYTAGNSHYYNLNGGADFRQFSVAYQSARKSEPRNFLAPALGFSYNTGCWAFGLGLWAPMGWGATWDLLRTASSNLGDPPMVGYDSYNAKYPKFEYESDIRVVDVHPTVAYQVNDQLSLGFGASLIFGSFDIRQPAFLQNPYLYERQLYNTLLSYSDETAKIFLDEMRKPPFDHLITEAHMNSSGTTWGANLGLMHKLTDFLTVGASVQYYADLKPRGDYSQITYFGDAPLFHNQAQAYSDSLFERLHNGKVIDDEQFRVLSEFYSGETFPRIQTQAKAHIPLPIRAGFGVSYSGYKNWLVAMDLSFTYWSVWDVIKIDEVDGGNISQLVQNWNDTFKYSLGLEYSAAKMKIRGGFGYETRAAVDESVSPTIPDIGHRINLNLGVAVPVGPLSLAVNFEKIIIPDREIKTWVYDDMLVNQNVAGTYSMTANSLMLGLDYQF